MDLITGLIAFVVTFPFVVIGWVIVGALAGEFARRITHAPDKSGCSDFVLGIAGAVMGGLLAGLVGVDGPMGGISLVVFNLFVATIGAALLVIIWRTVTGSRAVRQ